MEGVTKEREQAQIDGRLGKAAEFTMHSIDDYCFCFRSQRIQDGQRLGKVHFQYICIEHTDFKPVQTLCCIFNVYY